MTRLKELKLNFEQKEKSLRKKKKILEPSALVLTEMWDEYTSPTNYTFPMFYWAAVLIYYLVEIEHTLSPKLGHNDCQEWLSKLRMIAVKQEVAGFVLINISDLLVPLIPFYLWHSS